MPPRIRRCGELLKQVESDKGGYHGNYAHDATDTRITRTQAAIRRCGELLRQIESGQGKVNQHTVLRDGADLKQPTRESVATAAGLSERQRKAALRPRKRWRQHCQTTERLFEAWKMRHCCHPPPDFPDLPPDLHGLQCGARTRKGTPAKAAFTAI